MLCMECYTYTDFPLLTDNVHPNVPGDPPQNTTRSFQYATAESYCRLKTFFANVSSLRMHHLIISPGFPIRFGYCDGPCDSPYNPDAKDNTYVTDDVLIRHLANLDDVPLSDDQKKKFKTPCCVPIEYTSLWVTLATAKGARKMLLINAIPLSCGCR